MSLYLARIADPTNWSDDSHKRGWIPVLYKGSIRMAKPCMPLGVFDAPNLDWVRRNYQHFSVWLSTETTPFAAREDESLVYVGFYPVGGINYPEPPRTKTAYPNTAVLECGNWRIVIDKDEPTLEIQRISSEPELPDDTETHILIDPSGNGIAIRYNDGNLIEIEDGTTTITAGDDSTITMESEKITVKSNSEVHIDSALLKVGNGSDTAVLDQLLRTYMATMFFNTAMGPTAPGALPAPTADSFASAKIDSD